MVSLKCTKPRLSSEPVKTMMVYGDPKEYKTKVKWCSCENHNGYWLS